MDLKGNFLTRKLIRISDRKIKLWLEFILMLNAVITFLIIAFALAFETVASKIVVTTDIPVQIYFVYGAIFLTCLISIIFLQSIVRIMVREIFHNRMAFNLNVRLMGGSEKELFNIYASEFMMTMNKILPTSITLGIIIYLSASAAINFVAHNLLTLSITVAISIFFVILSYFLSIYFTLKKLVKFDLIDTVKSNTSYKKTNIDLNRIIYLVFFLFFVISFAFIRIDKSLSFTNRHAMQFYWNGLFLTYLFFKYNKYIFLLINFIGKKIKYPPLIISSKMIISNNYNIRKITALIATGLIVGNSFGMFFSAMCNSQMTLVDENYEIKEYFPYDKYIHQYYEVLDGTDSYGLDSYISTYDNKDQEVLENYDYNHNPDEVEEIHSDFVKKELKEDLNHKRRVLSLLFYSPSYFIIFIGILSCITWYVLNKTRVEVEIAKLRALGESEKELKKVGFFFIATIILATILICIPVTYLMANGHYYFFVSSMAEIIAPIKFNFIPIIVVFSIICIITYLGFRSMVKEIGEDKFISKLRAEG